MIYAIMLHKNKGQYCMENGQYETLSFTWQNQTPAELMTQAGEWLEIIGQPDKAMSYYEAALLVDPYYSLAAWRIGKLALERKNFSYATDKLRYALTLLPDHAPTHYLLSTIMLETGEYRLAINYADSALKYNPQHDGAYVQKLRALIKLEDWEELNSLCQDLSSSLNKVNEVHLWCALSSAKTQNLDTASEQYKMVSKRTRKRFPIDARLVEDILRQA